MGIRDFFNREKNETSTPTVSVPSEQYLYSKIAYRGDDYAHKFQQWLDSISPSERQEYSTLINMLDNHRITGNLPPVTAEEAALLIGAKQENINPLAVGMSPDIQSMAAAIDEARVRYAAAIHNEPTMGDIYRQMTEAKDVLDDKYRPTELNQDMYKKMQNQRKAYEEMSL